MKGSLYILFFGWLVLATNQPLWATPELDSLRNLVSKAEGQERADLLLNLSGKVWMSDPQESAKFAEQALEASEHADYKEGIIKSLLYWSTLASRQGDYALTEELALRVIEIAEDENEAKALAQGRLTLGSMFIMRGEYARAYETHLIGLANAIEAEDRYLERNFLLNIGVIKMELDDLDEAADYFNQTLKMLDDDGKHNEAGGIYINLGLIERERNNLGNAIAQHQKALEIFLEIDDKYHAGTAWSNIGISWQLLGKHELAIENFDKSIETREEIGDRSGLAKSTLHKATSLKDLMQPKKAEALAKHALVLSEELGQWELTKEAYEILYQLQEEKGNEKEAFDYFKAYTAAKDTVIAKANRDKIAELSTKYEVDDLRNKNVLQSQQAEIADLKLFQRNLLLAGLVLTLLILSLAFYFVQKRTKTQLDESRLDYLDQQKESKILAQELEAERDKLVAYTEEMLERTSGQEISEGPGVKHSEGEDMERILEKLNAGILNDKDWLSFNLLFEAAYPDFAKNLSKKLPDSTHNHQRLAALVKIQLSNKEIASVFHISRDSVVRAKYRLRKKMSFETNQEMEDYLKSI